MATTNPTPFDGMILEMRINLLVGKQGQVLPGGIIDTRGSVSIWGMLRFHRDETILVGVLVTVLVPSHDGCQIAS